MLVERKDYVLEVTVIVVVVVVVLKTKSTSFSMQTLQGGGEAFSWLCLGSKPLHHVMFDDIPHLFPDLHRRVLGKAWDALNGVVARDAFNRIVECGAPVRVLVAELFKRKALGDGDAKSTLGFILVFEVLTVLTKSRFQDILEQAVVERRDAARPAPSRKALFQKLTEAVGCPPTAKFSRSALGLLLPHAFPQKFLSFWVWRREAALHSLRFHERNNMLCNFTKPVYPAQDTLKSAFLEVPSKSKHVGQQARGLCKNTRDGSAE